MVKNIDYPSKESYHMYLTFWVGQISSLLGSAIVMFGITWYTADLIGNNNTLISLVFFIAFLPSVIFSPLAGHFADKYDKKKIIIIADSTQAGLSLILILFFAFSQVTYWHLMILNTLRGICQAFHSPVGFTLPVIFVPKDKITRINGIDFLIQSLIGIVGPVVGAWLLIFLDLQIIIWLDIITFGIALISLLRLRFPPQSSNNNQKESTPTPIEEENINIHDNQKDGFIPAFKDGLLTVKSIPGLINILFLAAFLNFLSQPFSTLSINFIKFYHGGGKVEYGIFLMIVQLGMFLGAIAVSLKKKWHNWKLILGIGLTSSSIIYTILGFIKPGSFYLLYIVGFFFVLLNPIVNTLFRTLIQMKIPPEKMGRVVSIIITVTSLLSPIGILISGPLADLLNSIPDLFKASGILGIIIIVPLFIRPNVLKLLDEGEKLANTGEEQNLAKDAQSSNFKD